MTEEIIHIGKKNDKIMGKILGSAAR